MNILIVHENPELRQTIANLIQNRRPAANVTEVGCLDAARDHLEWAHAVISGDSFSTHGPGHYEPVEIANGNWAPLLMSARRARAGFVLLSRSARLVAKLRCDGRFAYPMPGGVMEAAEAAVKLAEIQELEIMNSES